MPENIAALKDRLSIALEYRNVRPVELSEKTGIPKSAISQYMSGYAKPKDERVYLICKALDINEGWLLGFDVPMIKPINVDYKVPFEDGYVILETKDISNNQASSVRLLNHYLGILNTKGQIEALKRIKELSQISEYTENPQEELEAAHSIENATQEEKDHDDDIMENF